MTDRDILQAAYQRVREHSDEEVHGLIDELETVALQSDRAFNRIKQAVSQPVVVPLVSNDPTEIEHARTGYPDNDRFDGLVADVFPLNGEAAEAARARRRSRREAAWDGYPSGVPGEPTDDDIYNPAVADDSPGRLR